VELEGVEPSSNQATKVLSTCLSFYYFSNINWQKAADSYLIPLILPAYRESKQTISIDLVPHMQITIEKSSLRDSSGSTT